MIKRVLSVSITSLMLCISSLSCDAATQVVPGQYLNAPQANCTVGPCFVPAASGSTYKNITTATTTIVKASPGTLHSIIINQPVASSTITIYDNTAGSGTKIGTITLPATLLTEGPIAAKYDLDFTVGLTIVTTGTSDITVVYN